jgi:hypothetical protein
MKTRHIRVYLVGLLAAAVPSGHAAMRPTLESIVKSVPVDATVTDYPMPIRVLPLELGGEGGWSSVLGDRYSASDAFHGEFPSEFVAGLEAYLEKSGFHVVSDLDALHLEVTIHEFNGRLRSNRWVRAFGGDLIGSLRVLKGNSVVAARTLNATVDYDSRSEAVAKFNSQYGLKVSEFETVLFSRLSLQYFETIALTLARSEDGVLAAPDSAPRIDAEEADRAAGRLSVESTPPGAEIYVDERLVGTTPTGPLALAVGEYSLKLVKAGYQDWHRVVHILKDSDQTINAQLLRSD